jgi:hypothetical protein
MPIGNFPQRSFLGIRFYTVRLPRVFELRLSAECSKDEMIGINESSKGQGFGNESFGDNNYLSRTSTLGMGRHASATCLVFGLR